MTQQKLNLFEELDKKWYLHHKGPDGSFTTVGEDIKIFFSQKLLEVLEGLKKEDLKIMNDGSNGDYGNWGWNWRNHELNNAIEEIKKSL